MEYNEKDIFNIIKCQKIIRNRIQEIKKINKEANICYNSIYSIMKRTHNSFLQGLITQYEYNHNNVKLDEELESFRKIPRPFKLSNLKDLFR